MQLRQDQSQHANKCKNKDQLVIIILQWHHCCWLHSEFLVLTLHLLNCLSSTIAKVTVKTDSTAKM